MLIRDTADAFFSHADGLTYESKSEYRRALKEKGFVELGTDAPTTPRAPVADTISTDQVVKALDKVKQGYKPAPLPEISAAQSGFEWSDATDL